MKFPLLLTALVGIVVQALLCFAATAVCGRADCAEPSGDCELAFLVFSACLLLGLLLALLLGALIVSWIASPDFTETSNVNF